MAELVERALRWAELVEQVPRSLRLKNENILSTKSFCKFISCGGTCGRPECEEKARNFDWVWSLSAKIDRFEGKTGIPHLPAPADPVSKSETDSEAEPVELISFTSKYSEPPTIFDRSSDNQESSGFGCSNVITSDDSKLLIIMEVTKDSQSPHTAWKTLRMNADWPSSSRPTESNDSRSTHSAWRTLRINADPSSPSRQTETRQRARGVRTRGARRIKKRRL